MNRTPSFRFHHHAIRLLKPYDILSLLFLVCINLLILFFHSNLDSWFVYVVGHLFLMVIIVMIVFVLPRFQSSIVRSIRNTYSFFLLFFLFEEMERFTHLLFPDWKNSLLIDIDHFIFGVHPTVWLERLTTLPLTEFLECIYFSYYVLLPVCGFLLYFTVPRDVFEGALTAVAMAFYLCFIGYILLPAEGPWKTMAHLQTIDMNTSFCRQIVAAVQSRAGIVGGCFPSAHVSVAFAVLTSFFFYARKIFYFLLPYTILLACATVYGRYHYAIDSLVGMAIGVFSGIMALQTQKFWTKHLHCAKEG